MALPVKGFDGQEGTPITHLMFLNLQIGERRFLQEPMLITELGQHDMILGRNWLAKQDIWLDVRNRSFVWPNEPLLTDIVTTKQVTVLPRQILKRPDPSSTHQLDADRRNQQMNMEDWTKQNRWRPLISAKMNYKQNLKKMDRALKQLVDIEPPEEPIKVKTMVIKDLPASDIALIGAAAFSRHMKKGKSEVFTTSLYKIEKAIDSMTEPRSRTSELEETKKRLPVQYHD
jgi:hypothetical protein